MKRGVIVGGIFSMVLFLLMFGFMFHQISENIDLQFKKDVIEDFFMFSLNVSTYCAESNNMTYTELQDNYLINFTLELLDDATREE